MFPNLNPIQAPELICTECSNVLRRQIISSARGKLDKILYSCDTEGCKYTYSVAKEHQNAVGQKYVPAFTDEPLAEVKRTFVRQK